ncbi:sulfatase [Leptolinea tardivitalis]|uniref:Sulfatase N-terminal domain-containing protein n=1 Tax=Leptolinea tardivitalis TaxID=229920 RepID=A0A0P6XC28_9CHLR|nr:sulfatase [Leptolinea tardivitalis]KPL72801.1 hypothetical protein ADM99_06960 [Leptolinea tardivitalis]GAP20840.1 arylsulfatase A [Leptolinea tardivitalis]
MLYESNGIKISKRNINDYSLKLEPYISYLQMNQKRISPNFIIKWNELFITIFASSFLYVLSEWLFYITKPSFFDKSLFLEKIEILLFISCLLCICLFLFSLLVLLGVKILPYIKSRKKIQFYIVYTIPTFLISATLLLLFDNFTYTLFRIGIITARGILVFTYAVLFLGFVLLSYSYIERFILHISKNKLILKKIFAPALIAIIILIMALIFFDNFTDFPYEKLHYPRTTNTAVTYPNILWITADGLDSENMSLYGYGRKTTPTIDQLASSSLVFENAFSNAGNTTGSIVSMLTGKYPSTTKVLHPPDILRGLDSYQNMPAILQEYGYYSAQLSMRYYADAYELNMLKGFTVVNNRKSLTENPFFHFISCYLPDNYFFFIEELWNRIFDRLGYIFGGKESINPFEYLMIQNQSSDYTKINDLFRVIDDANNKPWFIETHFLGTHGPTFHISRQVFSTGIDLQNQDYWNNDVYDDSILEFDTNIKKVIDELQKRQLLDHTILIIGSDHGSKWDQLKRIPLLIHFPGEIYKGRIYKNVSNIDIAPTILDYLRIEKPQWMVGKSLLASSRSTNPIIGFTVAGLDVYEDNINSIDPRKIFPPFYQFGEITLINCEKWYKLSLAQNIFTTGLVFGSKENCSQDEQLDDQQVYFLLKHRLETDGFNTSSMNFPNKP